jgi:hypothetical protein
MYGFKYLQDTQPRPLRLMWVLALGLVLGILLGKAWDLQLGQV